MKKIVILLSLLLSAHSMSQTPVEECSSELTMPFFLNFFDSKCLEKSGVDKCLCLSKEKPSNFMLAELDKNEDIESYQNKLRDKRTKDFWDVYTQMTHGAAIQSEIIFKEDLKDANPEEKHIGCPPVEIASEFKKQLSKHMEERDKHLRKALGSVMASYTECLNEGEGGDCSFYKEQIDRLNSELKSDKKNIEKKITDKSQTGNYKYSLKQKVEESRQHLLKNYPVEREKDIRQLECIQIWLEPHNVKAPTLYLQKNCEDLLGMGYEEDRKWEIDEELVNNFIKGISTDDVKKNMKSGFSSNVNNMIHGLNNMAGTAIELFQNPPECNDELCRSFEEANKNALSAIHEQFQPSDNTCISYPEFLLWKGVPGEAFMEELKGMDDSQLANALTVPKAIRNKADQERLRFLRSNPLVAKLATSEQNKVAMARALRDIAKSDTNKTKPERLNNYLNFMKTSVKSLMNNESFKSQQEFLCKQMIGSYTSIQVATDLPPYEGKANELPLLTAVRECKVELINSTAITASNESLQMNELFRDVENEEEEESDEEKYKKLNERVCKGYGDFQKTCSKTPEECRQEFLSKSAFREENDVLNKHNVANNLSHQSFKRVANQSKDRYQDKEYKQWWKNNVGKKLKNKAVPYKSEMEDYLLDKALDESKVASLSKSHTYKTNPFEGVPEASVNSQQSKGTVNPGQIVPNYGAPLFDPQKLSPGQSVTKAINNYPSLPPSSKISGLEEVRDYLKGKKELDESETLKGYLEETEEILAEQRKRQKELEKKLAEQKEKSVQRPSFTSNVNQAPGPSHQIPAGLPSTPSASFGTASLSKTTQGNNAVNDALKSKEESINRGPSNVGNVDVVVKPGVVKSEELKGKLEVTQELTVESSEAFMKLVMNASDLEAYLESQLKKNEIGNGRIISILNPGTDSPVQHLLFRVHLENGRYVVQSMPQDVKVTRSSTLDSLRMNLKSITK